MRREAFQHDGGSPKLIAEYSPLNFVRLSMMGNTGFSSLTAILSAELMMRVLRQSGATKIGSWAIEKSHNDEFMLIYVAKLDATASHQALASTIEYVARLAGAMDKQLSGKTKAKSAEQTIAKWLAD